MKAKTMKIATLATPQSFAIKEVEIPPPAEDSVLLKVANCGICGTDLHFYKANYTSPLPNGHEISGQVVEAGKNVASFKEGDRVSVEINVYCGRCSYCLSGNYNLCRSYRWIGGPSLPGGNAEYLIVPAYTLHHLPDCISLEEGALLEPLAVGVHAVGLAGVNPGTTVAILGSGSVGLATLLAAKAYGAAKVLISAKYEHQALLAEKLGADYAIRLAQENLGQAIQRLTNSEGVDVTFNTASTAESLQDACKITRRKGRIVLLALFITEPVQLRIPWETAIFSSFIYGSQGLKKDYEIAIELVTSGKADIKGLITHRFPLDRIQEAYHTALDKNTRSVKVLVCP